jgi:hypothetical protein
MFNKIVLAGWQRVSWRSIMRLLQKQCERNCRVDPLQTCTSQHYSF